MQTTYQRSIETLERGGRVNGTSSFPFPIRRFYAHEHVQILGPSLVTGWDFRDKRIRTVVNGEVKQDGNTSEMEWDMHYLIADLARTITLEPGDVVFSGTPANSRSVEPGDVVTVDVEGLGALTNTIVEGPTPIRDDVGAQPSESEEVLSTAQGGDWEFRGVRPPRKDG